MKETIIGSLFVASLVLVLYFAFTLGGPGGLSAIFGEETRPVVIEFTEVTGLKPNSEVLISGLTQGTVKKIDLTDEIGVVHVTVAIPARVALFTDVRADMISNSVLGGRAINIYPGTSGQRIEEGKIIIGNFVPDFLTSAGRAMSKVDVILDNAVRATDDLALLMQDIREGRGMVGTILRDQQLATDVSSMVKNLNEASGRAKVLVAELERLSVQLNSGKGMVSRIIYDEKIGDDIASSTENIRRASQRADEVLADTRAILAKVDNGDGVVSYMLNDGEGRAKLDSLLENGSVALSEIEGTAREARTALTNANAGKGSLGKLMTDEALYNDAVRTLNTLQAGFEDLRESAPVTTFASVLFSTFQ